MRRLSIWLVLTAILASSSSIGFKKDVYIKEQEYFSPSVWAESLKSEETFDNAIFKTMQDVHQFFAKRNLEPRVSLDGGVGLMYKLE